MTDINQLIQTCAEITKSKGFDTSQHATQIALIATEVAEALECVTFPEDRGAKLFMKQLIKLCNKFERYRLIPRTNARPYIDGSIVCCGKEEHLDEELADIVIRVFSYAGGNGRGEQLVQALVSKIEKNGNRPHKHGKEF